MVDVEEGLVHLNIQTKERENLSEFQTRKTLGDDGRTVENILTVMRTQGNDGIAENGMRGVVEVVAKKDQRPRHNQKVYFVL